MTITEQRLFEMTVRATIEQLMEHAVAAGRPEIAEWIAEDTGILED